MRFEFTGIDELIADLDQIGNEIFKQAATTALNTTGKRVMTQVVKQVAKQSKVPQKVIRNRTKLKSKARFEDLTAVIEIFTKPVAAINLLSNQRIVRSIGTGTNRRGVTARGKVFPSAFIQHGNYRNIHVFKRTGVFKHQPGPRGGTRKEKIDVVKINVHDFVDKAIEDNLSKVASEVFPRILSHEIGRRIRRNSGRGNR